MLPHDFPPWKTVSYYFYTWRDAGVWEQVHAALRAEIRAAGRQGADARALAIIDSQSGQDDRGRRPEGVRRGEKRSPAASGTCWLTRWG